MCNFSSPRLPCSTLVSLPLAQLIVGTPPIKDGASEYLEHFRFPDYRASFWCHQLTIISSKMQISSTSSAVLGLTASDRRRLEFSARAVIESAILSQVPNRNFRLDSEFILVVETIQQALIGGGFQRRRSASIIWQNILASLVRILHYVKLWRRWREELLSTDGISIV